MVGLATLALVSLIGCGRGVSREPIRDTGTGGTAGNAQSGTAGGATGESGSGSSTTPMAIAGEGGEGNSPIDSAAGDFGAPPEIAGAGGKNSTAIGGGGGVSDPHAGTSGGDHGGQAGRSGGGDTGTSGANNAGASGGGDAGTSGASGGTTTGGSSGCSAGSPFETPQLVRGLATGASRLRFGSNETTGYYARYYSTSHFDLLMTVRGTLDASFGMERVVLWTGDWDFSPAVSSDGSTIFFERRVNDGPWWIYQATWNAGETRFESVVPVSGLEQDDSGPFLTRDGNTLYFQRRLEGRASIATAERQGQGFNNVTIVSFAGLDPQYFPVVSADELSLYFAVPNGPTLDSETDIWRATRISKQEKFSAPMKLTELSTTDNEVPSFLSDDNCRLYFDRNTSTPFNWGAINQAVWVATRQPLH
ncbi:MAG TPA: hypothetical protein VJV79_22770 [Polyangiaceae bacterium]|nr:hypothetical protein [Polyangiaceae bacterium]